MALQQYLRSNLAVASSIPSPVNPFDPKPWERTFRAGRSDVILLQVRGSWLQSQPTAQGLRQDQAQFALEAQTRAQGGLTLHL